MSPSEKKSAAAMRDAMARAATASAAEIHKWGLEMQTTLLRLCRYTESRGWVPRTTSYRGRAPDWAAAQIADQAEVIDRMKVEHAADLKRLADAYDARIRKLEGK